MDNLVIQQNGEAIITSTKMAQAFDKRHDNVLNAIKGVFKQSKHAESDFALLNFKECSYLNENNREMPEYHITEEGFAVLAMGFTGKKAFKFKIAIMDEFKRMREEINHLKSGALLKQKDAQINELVYTIKNSKLRAELGQHIVEEDKFYTLTTAKEILSYEHAKWTYDEFVNELTSLGFIAGDGLPRSDYIANGFFIYTSKVYSKEGEIIERNNIRISGWGIINVAVRLGIIRRPMFNDNLYETYKKGELTFKDFKEDYSKIINEIFHDKLDAPLTINNQLTK